MQESYEETLSMLAASTVMEQRAAARNFCVQECARNQQVGCGYHTEEFTPPCSYTRLVPMCVGSPQVGARYRVALQLHPHDDFAANPPHAALGPTAARWRALQARGWRVSPHTCQVPDRRQW